MIDTEKEQYTHNESICSVIPEHAIKDEAFCGRLVYFRDRTRAYVKNADAVCEFSFLLETNGHKIVDVSITDRYIDFIKIPIHFHRLDDWKRYPNLKLPKQELVKWQPKQLQRS